MEPLGVEYVSSFALTGIEKDGLMDPDEKLEVGIPYNAWQKELLWSRYTMDELGMSVSQPQRRGVLRRLISVENTGNLLDEAASSDGIPEK